MVLRGRGFSGTKRTDNVLCFLTVDQKTYGQCWTLRLIANDSISAAVESVFHEWGEHEVH